MRSSPWGEARHCNFDGDSSAAGVASASDEVARPNHCSLDNNSIRINADTAEPSTRNYWKKNQPAKQNKFFFCFCCCLAFFFFIRPEGNRLEQHLTSRSDAYDGHRLISFQLRECINQWIIGCLSPLLSYCNCHLLFILWLAKLSTINQWSSQIPSCKTLEPSFQTC